MKTKHLKSFPKELFYYIIAALIIWYCVILIIFGVDIKEGIMTAADRCLNVIIPSLFAFMAVSQIIINSGIYAYISKPFTPVSKYIMGIPPQLFFVFLMGNLAGYPVGIKLLSDMVSDGKLSKRSAQIFSVFCCCGGPAFYVGTVGLAVFGNARAGLPVFVSIVCANFTAACILGHILKPESNKSKSCVKLDSKMLTDSVIAAGKSLFTICVMILFFSTIMSALDSFNFFDKIKAATDCSENAEVLLRSVLEITCVTQLVLQPFDLLPLIAAVCSFGGVCVMIQIAALNKNAFSLKWFLITRPVMSGLSFLFCKLLRKLFIPEVLAVSAYQPKVLVKFNNFIPSVCLILMILLLILKKRVAFFKSI